MLMDEPARRSYDADREFLSPLEPTGARPPRCEIGKAATVTSGVAEAEVAAQVCPVVVVRRAILYERERREPVTESADCRAEIQHPSRRR